MNGFEQNQNKVFRKKKESRFKRLEGSLGTFVDYIVLIMTFPLDVIGAILKKVFGFMDETDIIPRVAMLIGVGLTFYAFHWTFEFVRAISINQMSGVDIAAIIGAILTPIAGLITILLRYGSKDNDDDDDDDDK